jgi:undecaprenyl-diphosphatase
MFSILACTAHPELILSLGTFSVLVAISRLVLGLHYPSDVLAAIGLGSLIGCLAITIAP